MSHENLVDKFSKGAEGWTEKAYANPEELMGRRAEVIVSWGATLQAGDTVLELGCGDGSLAYWLTRKGLRYTGTDFAPGMIEAARGRAALYEFPAKFFEMDMNHPEVSESFDCIFGLCRTFFAYCKSPKWTLQELRPHVCRKIMVDWNHFSPVSLKDAVESVREAGFRSVSCRPFLVPSRTRLPGFVKNFVYLLEDIPVLGLLPTRWRFSVIIKGEVD